MGAGASAIAEEATPPSPIFPLDVTTVLKIKEEALNYDNHQNDTDRLSEFISAALAKHGLFLARVPASLQYPEYFMDSVYVRGFLSTYEADSLFQSLRRIGEQKRPRTDVINPKYPLWALYYGMKREKDGALALDRWGSYHESWVRVEEAPECLQAVAEKVRCRLGLPTNEIVNSMVVNYYFDGSSTYIPAHRDTVNCLQSGSRIYCLSLGESRDFLFVENDDCGKYVTEQMTVVQKWKVTHGDILGIGQKTNDRFCHSVPQDKNVKGLRISIIFRSVDKSFIDMSAPQIRVKYASGTIKPFGAELISTSDINDEGTREHIAWLIADREEMKAKRGLQKQLHAEQDSAYFMGNGLTVPMTTLSLIDAL